MGYSGGQKRFLSDHEWECTAGLYLADEVFDAGGSQEALSHELADN